KGLTPSDYMVSDLDRAALAGTGQVKTAGNYAASLYSSVEAHENGFADCLFLDPKEHKYVDEFGGANFYGITPEGQFITHKSDYILPMITKKSLLTLAQKLGLHQKETQIPVTDVDKFAEAGAMGTAAVISPVASFTYRGEKHVIGDGQTVGPKTRELYDELLGIQLGDRPDTEGWVKAVKL